MEVCSNGQKDCAVLDSKSLTPLVVQENVPGVEFGALKQEWGEELLSLSTSFCSHFPVQSWENLVCLGFALYKMGISHDRPLLLDAWIKGTI